MNATRSAVIHKILYLNSDKYKKKAPFNEKPWDYNAEKRLNISNSFQYQLHGNGVHFPGKWINVVRIQNCKSPIGPFSSPPSFLLLSLLLSSSPSSSSSASFLFEIERLRVQLNVVVKTQGVVRVHQLVVEHSNPVKVQCRRETAIRARTETASCTSIIHSMRPRTVFSVDDRNIHPR